MVVVVSVRLSVGEIEAETRGTSNNKSCEKNAIIDYFQCFRSRPFHYRIAGKFCGNFILRFYEKTLFLKFADLNFAFLHC